MSSVKASGIDRKKVQAFKEYEEILDELQKNFEERWKAATQGICPNLGLGLDQYKMVRTLGTGAYGRVVLLKKDDGQYYAMKILNKNKIVKHKQLAHTYNEKRILQSVRFPFVVNLEFCFKDNSYVYLILPFINGGEMFTHLTKGGKFAEDQARFYAAQVALAIEYMHRCGIIYRDLKPENILLDKFGYLRLTDFGFAKRINNRTWTLCGTPEYLAPEIILSKGYNKSVDWWSFGVLIYEMVAGYSPFYSSSPMKIYEKVITAKYHTPTHFSEPLKNILKNLLQADLSRRFGNLKGGSWDIKDHRWFNNTDWLKIYRKEELPPFIPSVKGAGDADLFDSYQEENLIVSEENQCSQEFDKF